MQIHDRKRKWQDPNELDGQGDRGGDQHVTGETSNVASHIPRYRFDKTFRVRGIPQSWSSKSDVESHLERLLQCPNEESGLRCLSLAADYTEQTQDATINFSRFAPDVLQHGPFAYHLSDNSVQDELGKVVIDDNFLGLTVLNSSSKAGHKINVVALSGIGGHSFGSFKARGQPYMWLRDRLPGDMPGARVMIWGYESKIPASTDFQNLTDISTKLVTDLYQLSEDVASKPFVFIAHSLGGLVVKRTLINLSESHQPQAKNLLRRTSGLILFGVPSLGLEDAVVDSLVRMAEKQPNEPLLHSIRLNSEFLELLDGRFKQVFSKERFPNSKVYSIYETKASPTAIKKNDTWKMDGPEMLFVSKISATSARCGEESFDFTLAIGEDHSNMVKFTPDSEHYPRILQMIRSCQPSASKIHASEWTQEQRHCQLSFYTSDYTRHKERNPVRVEGTCRWVLDHKNFGLWLSSDKSSLLWITADPGCGKSVLAKSLVDIDLNRDETRHPLFFFFKEDNAEQRTVVNAISALLHQLFSQDRWAYLIKHAMPDFRNKGAGITKSFDTLWGILIRAATDPEAGEVICVLDALDECVENDRWMLLQSLQTFYSTQFQPTQHPCRLKFLVTSRPYLDLERSFSGIVRKMPEIRLEGELESERVSQEIDLVIKERVPQVAERLALEPSEQATLQERLLSIRHRTYLWLHLVLEDILDEIGLTASSFDQIIHRIPDSVERAYEAILSRSRDHHRVWQLLCLVIAATRPLSVAELSVALAIESQHRNSKELELEPAQRFKTTMRALCGLFLSVVDGKVYLLHQTAKEFLLTESGRRPPPYKFSIENTQAQLLMAEKCIRYLLLSDFDKQQESDMSHDEESMGESDVEEEENIPSPRMNRDDMAELALERMKDHLFLAYAARNWTVHFRSAQIRPDALSLREAVHALYNIGTYRFMIWYGLSAGDSILLPTSGSESKVALAAYLGHHVLLEDFLETQPGALEVRVQANETPLMLAMKSNDACTVETLLKAGANVQGQAFTGRTALHYVSIQTSNRVIEQLLERTSSLNTPDKSGWTPLMIAVSQGNLFMAKALLKQHVDLEASNHWGRTPLHIAAMGSLPTSPAIVSLLLKAGANLEVKDAKGRTALLLAAKHGLSSVVKTLLDAGADKKAKDAKGQNAEMRASKDIYRPEEETEAIKALLR